MSLWRESCQQLRHAVPKAINGNRMCQAQSKRFLSDVSQSSHTQLYSRRGAQFGVARGFVNSPRRSFSATAGVQHGHITPPKPGEELHVSFIDKDGQKYDFEVAEGDNLLDIAQANDLEMEGACGGSCACSTCHVIVEDPEMFDKMEEPSDDENDMLDLAFGLTETSRLGCQVIMTKDLDGLVVQLPSMTRNLQASDFAQKQ
ncbi:ferredoxin family 2Fe-2S iron-sulfur cluster binding protein [Aspergillus clavatus NRRL 1]|uniref:2Fe-2S iron-sulfur cluster binding domain protein n=1 Tax=Aspergillus clavatus (strain ATCC 1007 / CBS 513.65 / DSM 816 / NCTC 3887 / NRRL 1 / QM 1276 / 107) TaxID=344612 RepID=A1C4U5_ASPCL|nr:2Fe-2S iron-sulfur cluster binding domain protein [Aspergillus clavatus NRRL 1]EAW14713.1 2Fe-2S iron-sulfur cluster binding domain protein [Aspergillus clavatus NRRL 1]